jgi:hypothetical protein
MTLRRHDEGTPAGRLAAVARLCAAEAERLKQYPADYADYRAALEPYLRRELLLARVDETERTMRMLSPLEPVALIRRLKDLASDLFECDAAIGKAEKR